MSTFSPVPTRYTLSPTVLIIRIESIDLGDSVKFELVGVTDIREDDKYRGNKYYLIENLKINLDIDDLKLLMESTFNKRNRNT